MEIEMEIGEWRMERRLKRGTFGVEFFLIWSVDREKGGRGV